MDIIVLYLITKLINYLVTSNDAVQSGDPNIKTILLGSAGEKRNISIIELNFELKYTKKYTKWQLIIDYRMQFLQYFICGI